MNYILKKAGLVLITLLFISLITFGVFQLLPGDPAVIILGMEADPMQAAALREELGLDQPLYLRYIGWVFGLFTGNLGDSLKYRMPVARMLKNSLPVTLSLTVTSLCITLLIVVPFAIFLAKNNGRKRGVCLSSLVQIGVAVPSFWVGILLIMVFAVMLGWLPSGDYVPFSKSFAEGMKSILLPSLAISLGTSAVVVRYLKNTLLEQLNFDYVRTARSKGMTENRVLYKHVLKNALLPTVTIFGMIVVDILGGSIIIENVFNLPGIGTLLTSGVSSRDFPLVQGVTFYMACMVVMVNLITDVLYALIDPRIQLTPKRNG